MTLKARLIQCGVVIGRVCGMMLLTVSMAHAHGVSVFAWVDGDTVYVESKFSGGRKPKDALIEVVDGSGNLLLKGRTNAEGEFSFKVPQKTALKIVLMAGMGHRAEWTVPLEDLSDVPAPAAPPVAAPGTNAAGADSPGASEAMGQPPQAPPAAPAVDALTAEELQQTIEAALDRKLKPVMKMLAESRRTGPSVRDVIGGLGYILGLVGLATFLRYRKNSDRS
jgi:nickel transport protein